MLPQIDRILDAYDGGRLSRRTLMLQLAATDVNHIALRVTDVSRSRTFYEEHLGLTLRSDNSPNSVFMNVGTHDFLALFRADTPAMDHYCYTVKGYTAGDAVTRLDAAALKPRRRAACSPGSSVRRH